MSEVTSGYRRTAIYSGSVDVMAEENFSKAEALLNGIPGGVYKAVGSALTRAASAGKTEAKRAVAQEYTIGSGDFLRYTRNINHFVRGGDGGVEVVFGFAGYPIPLMHFQMSIDGEGRPVAHVKRSNAPEVLRHAFRANAGSHWGIYERVGPERFPIRQLYGPARAEVRSIFAVYHENSQEGQLALLEMFERVRIALLKKCVIGRQFRLDVRAGIEYLVYPDNIYPFYAGEMVSTWKLPPIESEVTYGKQGYSNIQIGPRGRL